ncbi:MAG: hypothetical protein ACOC9N_03155 [Gemmatimonadota bacterium]
MYSRCIACHGRLGANEVLETFSVGRRVAFDPAKGRLWVLCPACRNWNLAPLEERWEAVEEAERAFEGATVGASTENIALGRLREGTELIRVGRTRRRELAAWRYAGRLASRWRRSAAVSTLGAGGVVGLGLVAGLGLLPTTIGAALVWAGLLELGDRRPAMRTDDGRVLRVGDGRRALLRPGPSGDGWVVAVPRPRSEIVLEGGDALRALRRMLPRANMHGGSPGQVDAAAAEMERVGSADALIRTTASELGRSWNADPKHVPFSIETRGRARPHRIATAKPVLRLALEMAANEQVERRALRGAIGLLEREWREAEELAAIADDLALPASVRRWMRRHGPP